MALSLSIVEDAIEALLTGGQSYSRAGFTFTRASLNSLIKLRDKMKAESARSSTTGGSFITDFSGGSGSTESDEWGD